VPSDDHRIVVAPEALPEIAARRITKVIKQAVVTATGERDARGGSTRARSAGSGAIRVSRGKSRNLFRR
jgi:hypothetical protein